jgi:hypothetical protein
MRYLITIFIKRLPRERFKSLSVSALAFALVFLINVLGGVKAQMEAEYEYVMENHPIHIVVSDGDGIATDGLEIGANYIDQFTDPEAFWSLSGLVKDVRFKRTLDIIGEPSAPESAMMYGVAKEAVQEDGTLLLYMHDGTENADGSDNVSDYIVNATVTYFNRYDRSIFTGEDRTRAESNANTVVISEDLLKWTEYYSEWDMRVIPFFILRQTGFRESDTQRTMFALLVAGTVSGAGSNIIISSEATAASAAARAGGHVVIREITSGDVLLRQITEHVFMFSGKEITGQVIGISSVEADERLASESGASVLFYGGYDERLFESGEYVCVVSEDMLRRAEDGLLRIDVCSKFFFDQSGAIEAELRVAGVVTGTESGMVFVPYQTASELGMLSDGQPPHTELLRATLADNKDLLLLKDTAARTFSRVGIFFNPRYHAMTIFDSDFYDKTEALMQTIFFIDITTPFVYALSVCVGFVASFLLTRRRKAEFAVMRSIGVNKRDIFAGALFEQFSLCLLGTAAGSAVYSLTWGGILAGESLIFLGCYTLGAAVSALRAAGTDVLKILRDKE